MATMSKRRRQKPKASVDPAITRADALVAELRDRYPALVSSELKRLIACWAIIHAETPAGAEDGQERDPPSQANREELYRMSHDFKGHAGSYGYPLVSMLAGSVCQLIKKGALETSAGRSAVGRRIKAMQLVINERLSGDGGERAKKILAELRIR